MSFNKLLERQILKTLSEEALADPAIKKLLNLINDSYNSYEKDKEFSERSFQISEEDYIEINDKLNVSYSNLNSEIIKTLTDAEILVESFNEINSYDLLIENIKVQIELVAKNDITTLYLFSEEENKLKLFYTKGFSQKEKEDAENNSLDELTEHVFTTGNGLWVKDSDKKQDIHSKYYPKQSKSRSLLYVPIKSSKKIIGVMGIQSKTPNAFTEKHLAILKVFAALAGDAFVAIKKNYLIQKQNEENERLSSLARSTTNNVIYTDANGKITWVNKHFEESTGYLLSEIAGKTPGSFLAGDATEPEKTKELSTAIKEQKPCSLTITNYNKKGETYKVDIKLNPIFDANGVLINFVSIQNDVTESEKNKLELEKSKNEIEKNLIILSKSEKKYNNLLQISSELITSLDNNGTITFINNRWLSKMNYQLDEVIGTNIFNHIHPDSQVHCKSFFNDLLAKNIPYLKVQYSLISKSGNKIEVDGEITCNFEDGKLVTINSFLKDVTEINKLKLEQELRNRELSENKEKLEHVLDSLSETVWGRSLPSYNLEYISKSAVELYGMPLTQWHNNRNLWLDVIHPEDRERVEKENEKLFDLGELSLEHRIITSDKKVKWILSNTKIIKDKHGIPFLLTGISRDITIKKITEIELLNYKKTINESAIVSITDLKGNIIYVNNKFCEISKYSSDELIGANHRKINSGFHPKEFFQDMWKTISSGNIWTGEIQNKAKDGSIYYVESTIIPFMKDGKPDQFIAIRYDSTEKVLAKLAVDEQKKFYETILNNIPGNVAVFDKKGNYIFINPNTVKDPVLREWLIGKNNYDYFNYRGLSMDLAIERDKQFQLLLENGKSISTVEKRKNNDGIDTYLNSILILHEYNGEKLIIAYALDVTDLKTAESKVSELILFYENILNNIPVDIAVFDNKHRYLFLNKEAVKNDETRHWLIGKDDFDYAKFKGINTESAEFRRNQFNSVMETDNQAFWLETHTDALGKSKYKERRFHSYDNKKYVVGYAVDVTVLKENEQENEKITKDIVQRNKDLEQFSYIVSHNLRLPVANIMGFANILNNDILDDIQQSQFRNALLLSTKKLDEVIVDLNNILQIRRDINEKREIVIFSNLINNITDSIQDIIKQEKVKIISNFEAINEFNSIKSYLYSIFYNLISNSIKYKQQDIPLIIEIKSSLQKNKLILSIKDNGSGIDLGKNKDLVFGLYKRFHTKIEGKGMGLYMVKTQVESLSGKIRIESEINIGTEFIIEFELNNNI